MLVRGKPSVGMSAKKTGSSEEFVGESGESVAVNPPAPGGGFAPATL
jgi:hypothetical protein